MSTATSLMAYSMSKTITAVAVLQLAEKQKFALDDAVSRYLPVWPYGSSATIRQLLTHTTGIPNPIPLRWVHPADGHSTFDEDEALAAVLRKYPRLVFEPGSRFQYSNLGYWLLGKLVESVSADPFTSYVIAHILRPLGMDQEVGFTITEPASLGAGYLKRYSYLNLFKGFVMDRELFAGYEGDWLRIRSHYLNGPAFGGLVGNARGFGKFLRDQLQPHSVLLNDSTRSLLYAPQRTARGKPIPMTLGWHVGELGGSEFYYKEGGGGGFSSMMRIYPKRGFATIIMANATGFKVGRCLDAADSTITMIGNNS